MRVVFFPELSIHSFILFISVPVRCGHFACFFFLLQVVFSCCSTSIVESVCLVYLLLDSHYVLLIPCPRSTQQGGRFLCTTLDCVWSAWASFSLWTKDPLPPNPILQFHFCSCPGAKHSDLIYSFFCSEFQNFFLSSLFSSSNSVMVFFISTTPVSILFFAMMEVLSANEDNDMLTSTASLLNFSQSLGPFFCWGHLSI